MTPPILPAVARGEVHAVDECIRRYSSLVWMLARRHSPTLHDAEDAVQEVFLEIWRSAARYDPALASETTFIAMITRRRLIDRGRHRTRTPTPAAIDTVDDLAGVTAVDAPELRDETERATAAIEQLRPEQRGVLKLFLMHGRTHREIAESTGLPLGTVKSHARRGLQRVREMLGVTDALDEEKA